MNGKHAGSCEYGYRNFYVRIDPLIRVGEVNRILVIADNSKMPNSRWYSGSGIYRPVHLFVQNKDRILLNGIKIATCSISPCEIRVKTEHTGGEVSIEIIDDGCVVATATGDDITLTVPNGKPCCGEAVSTMTMVFLEQQITQRHRDAKLKF